MTSTASWYCDKTPQSGGLPKVKENLAYSQKNITFEKAKFFVGAMNEENSIVESLKQKVLRVLDDNRALRQQLQELTSERDGALRKSQDATERIQSLGRRIELLETATGFAGGRGDLRTARLRVNKLLREIDKCLALMNK